MKRLVFLALGMYCLSACGYVIAYRKMQVANDKQALVRDYRTCVESHQTDPSVCSGILEGLNSTVTVSQRTVSQQGAAEVKQNIVPEKDAPGIWFLMVPQTMADLSTPLSEWKQAGLYWTASECEQTKASLKTFIADPSVVAAAVKETADKHEGVDVRVARFRIENFICAGALDPRLGEKFPENESPEVWFLKMPQTMADLSAPLSSWDSLGNAFDTAFDCELIRIGLEQYFEDPNMFAAAVRKMAKKPTEAELRAVHAAGNVLFKSAVCVETDDPRLKEK